MGESGGEEEVGKDGRMNGREGRKERKKGRGSWECALTVLGFGWEKKGIVSNHLLVGKLIILCALDHSIQHQHTPKRLAT